MPQSRRRHCTCFSPRFFAFRSAAMASTDCWKSMPSYLPELMHRPCSTYDSSHCLRREVPDVDDLRDRQAVLVREGEVALVVRRHAHHRALAVGHEDVVAHPDGNLLAADRVRDEHAGGHAFLLDLRQFRLEHRAALALLDEFLDFRILFRGPGGDGMFGRHRAEGRAHQGVGARREYPQHSFSDFPACTGNQCARLRSGRSSSSASA